MTQLIILSVIFVLACVYVFRLLFRSSSKESGTCAKCDGAPGKLADK